MTISKENIIIVLLSAVTFKLNATFSKRLVNKSLIPTPKKQIGIRIPQDLDCRLTELVNKIGISKPAFILGLIFRELEKNHSDTDNSKSFK